MRELLGVTPSDGLRKTLNKTPVGAEPKLQPTNVNGILGKAVSLKAAPTLKCGAWVIAGSVRHKMSAVRYLMFLRVSQFGECYNSL